MTWRVLHGASEDVLPTLPADSFDALVTDPPAGIGFMGKPWDGDRGGRDEWIVWLASVMWKGLRVLKPGAYGLVWALPRTSHWTATALEDAGFEICDKHYHFFGSGFPKHKSKLKPAVEEWILVRKPAPRATLLNIDACRIGFASDADKANAIPGTQPATANGNRQTHGAMVRTEYSPPAAGRWPAHLSLDEEAASMLDEQSGVLKTGAARTGARANRGGFEGRMPELRIGHEASTGGASRFFYVAKASRGERGSGNDHPTVKPLALMNWLLRLITPPGGHVLDPFAGSGTTLVAAQRAGFHATGIEQHGPYVEIARRRLLEDAPLLNVEAVP